jgi:hypothetical protein
MAAFFLLLAVLIGVVLGDALVENDSASGVTLFGQTTGRFTEGQLLLVFGALGFLLGLLLLLSMASNRGRRSRRKGQRADRRALGGRVAELERDNARLKDDLARRHEELTGREAELAHRDQQLAIKDEELARRGDDAVPVGASRAPEASDGAPPAAARVADGPAATRTEVFDQQAPKPAEVADRTAVGEPVAPLHDESPWFADRTDQTDQRPAGGSHAAPGAGDAPGQDLPAGDEAAVRHPAPGAEETPRNRPPAPGAPAPERKPDQNS